MRNRVLSILCAVALCACGESERPALESGVTAISFEFHNPDPKAEVKVIPVSAMVEIYINNQTGSVNYRLSDPSPVWALQSEELKAALDKEARRVIEATYPHLGRLEWPK
jgi:hypothetical protein